MDKIEQINYHLQSLLVTRDQKEITAVEAAQLLDQIGLLPDSESRPGKPLRDLLRQGKITGQRQDPNGRWFIESQDHAVNHGIWKFFRIILDILFYIFWIVYLIYCLALPFIHAKSTGVQYFYLFGALVTLGWAYAIHEEARLLRREKEILLQRLKGEHR